MAIVVQVLETKKNNNLFVSVLKRNEQNYTGKVIKYALKRMCAVDEAEFLGIAATSVRVHGSHTRWRDLRRALAAQQRVFLLDFPAK